ncbi:uncharacterized protein BO66DRAFT_116320 [Aspergillus aculeatinus CBS 121060]|uniref:Uncharacterized protein n=1 Tax=Aspergillus aculeatinus CBS 121060 TaxID=1448322 RepID=A0ACD1H6I5_9EURO|nr:hypothetical protein BO66DRAFT_116320 [Aspergillus aculeatinus CBS 121060]RAH69170.1 hypothetical protein BO66DRAFT_116320 [Aspergillus aculeatinus CBS 121060]
MHTPPSLSCLPTSLWTILLLPIVFLLWFFPPPNTASYILHFCIPALVSLLLTEKGSHCGWDPI